ncbi:MAG: hypothetical protein U0169_10575 [Polyangiaceae bacterium]
MSKRLAFAALAFTFTLIFVSRGSAHADVPSPEPETCTNQLRCGGRGETCNVTRGTVDEVCKTTSEGKGLVEVCRTAGATVATALFCNAADVKDAGASPSSGDAGAPASGDGGTSDGTKKGGGCATSGSGPSGLALTSGALALGAFLRGRRRRGKSEVTPR